MDIQDIADLLQPMILAGEITPEQAREILDRVEESDEFNDPPIQKTSWFTFGWGQVHDVSGLILDKDIVLEITSTNPRDLMIKHFGMEWAEEHDGLPKMHYYPRGVITLAEVVIQQDVYRVDRGEMFI